METIPISELNHHTSRVTAKVKRGTTVHITEHGKPIMRLVPEEEAATALDRLATSGKVYRSAHPGAMPELIDDLADLPSLSDLLIAERDKERNR
ncbi:type II toxin-antitoxin system Phd/YefM family antitoxin [Streptomyces spiramyceticus]|uniref:type II toxin-antitoxin system Phd/YefM family antitoxin n=1 Tax=Streptomyces spiramyceticus TaxID=299717 RepID=UPI00237A63CD|nr:type II toxin-antitoxin system prevent-host-death family antitoxin [Streptomyces spiramyceticus]